MSVPRHPPAAASPTNPVDQLIALNASQWDEVISLLPPGRRTGRRRTSDVRGIVAAIDYYWRTGCTWRDLPPGFPPWSTVYTYYRKWVKDGTARKLRAVLHSPRPSDLAASGRQATPPPAKLDPDRQPPKPR